MCVPKNESKTAVFEALPQWFRACADEMYKKRHGGASFEAVFSRSANTTMPVLQKIPLPHILGPRRAECKLVHVSRTDICMCSLSMLRIRFEVSPAGRHMHVSDVRALIVHNTHTNTQGFKCHDVSGVWGIDRTTYTHTHTHRASSATTRTA